MTIRVIELFAGIGSQAEALKEIGVDYEVVAICEIDKHAVNGYEAIHGPVNNLGDITKVEHLPECDLVTYSFPCQDLSAAGKRRGMDEGSGTRSSLLWEVGRLLEDMKERDCLPEVLLMENVDAILNQQNYPHFIRWITTLSEMGYISSYEIMNAKDYGTPQSRRRCFMVSTLTKGKFIFPEPCPDGRVLRDILETDVPESYYLSDERVAKFERHRVRQEENGRGFGWSPKKLTDEYMNPVTTNPDRNATGNFVDESGVDIAGSLNCSAFNRANKVMADTGNSMTVTAEHGGINFPKIMVEGSVSDFQTSGNVYADDGIAPVQRACGYKDPTKILVEGHLGQETQHYKVYNADGVAPTIGACDDKDPTKIITEGDLNIDGWGSQDTKVHNPKGMSPTIPAQCNNTRLKIIVEGELEIPGFIDHDKRVHSADGVSPCLSAQTNTQRPKIIEEEQVNWPADNEEGYMVAKEGDALVMSRPHAARSTVMDQQSFALTCGSGVGVVVNEILTPRRTEFGKAVRKEYEKGNLDLSRKDMTHLEPRNDGVSNTITTVKTDNMLLESADTIPDLDEGEIAAMHTPGREEKRQNGPRCNDGENSFTVTAADKDGIVQKEKGKLRIRYLTPRECLRLQAFPEDAIDRLMAVESKSQCYKLAGNSIAVCCLKAIFKGIYIDETFVKGGRQLSLKRWF